MSDLLASQHSDSGESSFEELECRSCAYKVGHILAGSHGLCPYLALPEVLRWSEGAALSSAIATGACGMPARAHNGMRGKLHDMLLWREDGEDNHQGAMECPGLDMKVMRFLCVKPGISRP